MNIWLDDKRPTPPGFVGCRTPAEVVALLETGDCEILSLDHDLGLASDESGHEPTGYDVLTWLEERVANGFVPPKTTLVHSANPAAKQRMMAAVESIERLTAKGV